MDRLESHNLVLLFYHLQGVCKRLRSERLIFRFGHEVLSFVLADGSGRISVALQLLPGKLHF